jgi:uncharacterized protein (TIGR00299 family) protein
MTLGALVDLGVDTRLLYRELDKLDLSGWSIDFVKEERCGITGTRAVVNIDNDDSAPHTRHGCGQHGHGGENHGHCRAWRDIRALIEKSGLNIGAKERSLSIFSRVAAAEAEVHGVPVDEVSFHEVGALDSIIDIVGNAVCLDMLKPDRITSSEIELGGGVVKCAHGILPVPAPATLKLCEGLPVRTGGFNKEMTTPTGAAILAASVDEFVTSAVFKHIKTAYGVGSRKLDRPNVLAVSWREERLGAALPSAGVRIHEELTVIETNIDDMTGEALGFLMDRLFEAGALDVTFTSCMMKRSRPGVIVSVLCPNESLILLRRVIFERSSTIGFRETTVRRVSLPREQSKIRCGEDEAEVKTVFLDEKMRRSKIEYRDRERLARERGLSLDEAEEIIKREYGSP